MWLGKLTGLQTLSLWGNDKLGARVGEAGLGGLTGLTSLDMSRIGLLECPMWVGELTGLHTLDLSRNGSLRTPHPVVVKEGATAVVQYMRDLAKGSVPCHILKMMLLGDPRAGKSSLLDTLASGKPTMRPEEDRTVRTCAASIARNLPFAAELTPCLPAGVCRRQDA